jgi:transcriptional regulator with XRE-family HTH domain
MLMASGRVDLMAKKKALSKEKTLGAMIKSRREGLDLGLRKAARDSHLSLSMWQYLESGRTSNPTLDTLRAVASTLKCKVGDLVD